MNLKGNTVGLLLILGWFGLVLGACSDALRIEPPAGGSTTATSGVGGMGTGGALPIGGSGGAVTQLPCTSNSDCPEPTAVCDTVKGYCVECLLLSDCAHKPGTVCDLGACSCPGTDTWCGPDTCVDLATSPDHCGSCEHGCFGACVEGACADPWEKVSMKNAPTARRLHVAVWTGTQMVVWGGSTSTNGTSSNVNSGGVYDLASDTWWPTSLVNAPTPRQGATAVWSGTHMIVWGGRDGSTYFADGGMFDPASNTWTTISAHPSVPDARWHHTAVWSGTEMIIWGGSNDNSPNQLSTGGRFDPAVAPNGNWVSTAVVPSPSAPRELHSAVWAGTDMIIYGGFGDEGSNANVILPSGNVPGGRSYSATSDAWDVISIVSQPSARQQHTAVWDDGGMRMLIFGGNAPASPPELSDGYKFEAGAWSAFSGTGPAARYDHSAVWLSGPKLMVVWGGRSSSAALDTGGVYDPATNAWTKATPTALEKRFQHSAVSTGDKMIVWGGRNISPSEVLSDGGVYTP